MDQTYIAAVSGDPNAQSQMLDRAFDLYLSGAVPPEDALDTSEHWARMAAAQGRECDLLRLGGVLAWRSGFAYGQEKHKEGAAYAGETLVLLDALADSGCEAAGAQLVRIGYALQEMGVDQSPFDIATGFQKWRGAR